MTHCDYERTERITMTLEEFHQALRDQHRERPADLTYRCPRCGLVQSGQDLIDAGAGKTWQEVEKYAAFSCVGRWSKTKGCDWTLGGLFQIHELEVITPDGEHHPRMMPVKTDTKT
jgi:hypothetical protein